VRVDEILVGPHDDQQVQVGEQVVRPAGIGAEENGTLDVAVLREASDNIVQGRCQRLAMDAPFLG
jgi:hypothetical protein